MRVLITGAAGFIGSHLVRRFTGHDVVCYDPNSNALGYDMGEKGSLTRCPASVFDRSSLHREVGLSDVIIHLVALADIPTCQADPSESFSLNVHSLEAVLEACRCAGGKKLVFPSTASVYGITDDLPLKETAPLRPNSIYAHHKVMCEAMLQAYLEHYGIEYVILRLFNVYGHGVKGVIDRFIAAAAKGEEFEAFGLSQYRDWVYTGDIADAFYMAALSDKATNKVVNIGSGRGTQIREVLQMVQSFYPGVRWRETRGTGPLYDSIADITRARLLLDFEPHAGREFMVKVMEEEIIYENRN